MPNDLKKSIVFETAFARYTATKIHGESGSGRVYRATDDDGSIHAIKVLDHTKATRERRKRFKNEVLFGMLNRHPHLITVVDHGVHTHGQESVPFYVMPFYERSLRTLINVKMAPNNVLKYFAHLLDGVEAAHLQKVIHRDLKPENVLHDKETDRLLVADFGIARFKEEEIFTLVETAPNARLANFQYAAPEQRRKGMPVEQRADIYALGLMLNEMFTGEVPQGTAYKTIAAVASEYSYLDEMVAAMLRQGPRARPASIYEIKQQLIARKNDFITQQRLSELRQTVIPIGEIDDPLILDPPRLVEVDYRNGELLLRLQRPVTPKWVQEFHNFNHYKAPSGKEPARFSFNADVARIPAGEQQVQEIVDYFKHWLPEVQRRYHQKIDCEKRAAESRRREELAAKIAEEERRLRLLRNIRI